MLQQKISNSSLQSLQKQLSLFRSYSAIHEISKGSIRVLMSVVISPFLKSRSGDTDEHGGCDGFYILWKKLNSRYIKKEIMEKIMMSVFLYISFQSISRYV